MPGKFCRFFSLLLLCISFFLALSANASAPIIVVGQVIDLSGPNGSNGRDYVAGIKTYFDSVNAGGGINGRNIRYIVRDDHGAPEKAVKAVEDLIEHDRVDYLFGGGSEGVVNAVLNSTVFKRSGHVLFAPLIGSDMPDNPRVIAWRPSYSQEIDRIFNHFAGAGAQSVGIAYQDTSANHDAYRTLMDRISQRKMKLNGMIRIGDDRMQLAKEAQRFAAQKPGFVIVIADTIATGLFLKEFRKYEREIFVAGTSLVNLTSLVELAGANATEWTVFSQVVPNPLLGGSVLQLEHLKMMKRFRDEEVSSLTLEGFAVAKSWAKVIQQAKTGSRNPLQDAIARKVDIDLGGLSIVFSAEKNRLSNHVDVALFNKSRLKF